MVCRNRVVESLQLLLFLDNTQSLSGGMKTKTNRKKNKGGEKHVTLEPLIITGKTVTSQHLFMCPFMFFTIYIYHYLKNRSRK